MEKEDLKQVKYIIHEEFGSIWQDNIQPALDSLHKDIKRLPDKAYLDSKLADLEGSLVVKLRKEDEKVNRLIELLKERKVLEQSEVEMLKQFDVFPSIHKAN